MARALEILRASDRTAAKKDLTGGVMILTARAAPARRLPAESPAQGLAMVERAALSGGGTARAAAGQLRLLFARGTGPVGSEPAVATCWAAVLKGDGTAERCVALRKEKVRLAGG